MTTPLSRRATVRAVVGGVVGTVVAVGAVTVGGQALDRTPVGAPVAAAALQDQVRPAVRESVAAVPGAGRAVALQAPLLDLVTPAPARAASDRTGERASRDADRGSAAGSASSGSGSSGSGSSGSGSSGSGSSGSGSSGSGSSGSGSSGSGSSGSGPAAPAPAPGGGSTASQVVAAVNVERAGAGCGPVSADAALTAAAQGHSADMAANDYFSHTSRDGRSFADRIRAAGYTGGSIAENIAAGQSTAAAVMAGWMDSPGHRANILNCSLRHIGVGVAQGGSYGTYWTQTFGG